MKDRKSHKLKFNPYLEKLYQSDKPLIIYKVDNGYDIYTDFSKKINLTKKNIHKFLNSFEKMKYKKETDQYVGFFGYEILNYLLGIKISKQSKNGFYKGVFYKPETIIKIRDNISIFSNKKKQEFNYYFKPTKILSPFKLNIKYQKYKKIFDIFSKKIRQGETYQIKICTKYVGLLYGIVFVSHQIGSFLGAYLGGVFYELNGNFDYAWYGSIALSLFAGLIHLPIIEKAIERTQPA